MADVEDTDHRVNRLLEKLDHLQEPAHSEDISNLLKSLATIDAKWQSYHSSNNSTIDIVTERLYDIERRANDYAAARARREQQILDGLATMQHKCKLLINQHVRHIAEAEGKEQFKTNTIIKKHQSECIQMLETRQNMLSELSKYEELLSELNYKFQIGVQRKQEAEQNAYNIFANKLTKMKEIFYKECKQREQNHTILIELLRETHSDICLKLKQEQSDRETNETLMIRILQQTIDKISSMH